MRSWSERLHQAALLLTAFLYSAGYASLGLLLMLIAVAADAILWRRIPWPRTALDVPVVAFLGVFLLSGYLSEFKPIAIGSAGLAALTVYLALGSPSRALRRNDGFLRPFLWAWLGGSAVAAAWAFDLHRRTGLPAFMPELGQNAVGTTMLIAALIGLGLLISTHSGWRYVAAGMTAMTLVTLILTYTRGAWLGAVVGLVVLLTLSTRRAALTIVVLVVAIGGVGVMLAGPERVALGERALRITSIALNRDRVFMLRAGGAIFADHLVLGTGLNTFQFVYPRYRLPGDVNPVAEPYAHNIFLNMGAEGGVLGLAAFVAILGQTIRSGWWWRAAASRPEEAALRSALLAAFSGMLVHQVFDGTLISVHLGAGMWMIMAILTVERS